MSVIHEAIKDHHDECKTDLPKKYVSWLWLVGILATGVVTISGASWAMSKHFTTLDMRTEQLDVRMQKIEQMQDDIRWMRKNWTHKDDK